MTCFSLDLDTMQDPAHRDQVVAAYKALGQGSERYGVSCPACFKRVCAQGYDLAKANPGQYCTHLDQYEAGTHEGITAILAAHGLPQRPLRTRVKMHEATRRKQAKEGK